MSDWECESLDIRLEVDRVLYFGRVLFFGLAECDLIVGSERFFEFVLAQLRCGAF